MRVEADARAEQAPIALCEQTGADEQQQRQRELRARQHRSRSCFASRSARTRPTASRTRNDPPAIAARSAGKTPNSSAVSIGDRAATATARPSSASSRARGRSNGAVARNHDMARHANTTPSAAAEDRERSALDGELPRDLASARTERESNRDLASARRAAHRGEVGEVDARDEQDERDRTAESEQRRAHVADDLGLQAASPSRRSSRLPPSGSPLAMRSLHHGKQPRGLGGIDTRRESPDRSTVGVEVASVDDGIATRRAERADATHRPTSGTRIPPA